MDEMVRKLRQKVMKNDDDKRNAKECVQPEKLRKIALAVNESTSIGGDHVTFKEIAAAPHEALQELSDVYEEVIDEVALPNHALVNLMSMLGKKAGGSRCIAVGTTFCRLLMMALNPMARTWDSEVGSEFDSALTGKSPLMETIKRMILVEDAELRGHTAVLTMWDIEKFFDTIDLEVLFSQADKMAFPQIVLALGINLHRAPRVQRVLGTCAEPISQMGRSILAGCTLSTSFARAFLRAATEGMSQRKVSQWSPHAH